MAEWGRRRLEAEPREGVPRRMEYTAKRLRPLGGEAISTATLNVCVCVCVCVCACVICLGSGQER